MKGRPVGTTVKARVNPLKSRNHLCRNRNKKLPMIPNPQPMTTTSSAKAITLQTPPKLGQSNCEHQHTHISLPDIE